MVTSQTVQDSSLSSKKDNSRRLHRIEVVRRQQGVSLRSVARRTGVHVSQLRVQEQGNADLTLSQLYLWQRALEVPVSDLLVDEDESLSRPVMQRARMVRLMKSAAAIRDTAGKGPLKLMAENLISQLEEMMPELAQVNAWPSVGQRRSQDEYGAAYDRRLSDETFSRPATD